MEKNELPKGWENITLEDCVHILDSKRIPVNSTERENRKGDIPYYGATGQIGWIDDYLFNEELVLLGEDGAPFYENFRDKAYIITGKSWVNNHAHVLRATNNLMLNKYLCHYLNHFDYHGFVTGTTRLKLNQFSMRKIPILVSPLNEQKRIVDKIDELYSKIDSTTSTLQEIKLRIHRYKQSLLRWIFYGNFKDIYFKNSKWEKFSVNELYCIVGGGTPSTKNPTYWNGKIPWITSADIYGIKDIRPRKKVSKIGIENSATNVIPKNSILIVTRVGLGKLAIADEPICINQDIQALIEKNSLIYFPYALHYLSEEVQIFKYRNRGTTISGVTKKQLADLPFILPSIEDQKKIVIYIEKQLTELQNMMKIITDTLSILKFMKYSILLQAFNGTLVPQDPNDESASELLKRIKK